MNKGLISVRYAKALLQFAQNNSVEHEIYEQSKFLSSIFFNIPNLHTALNNPMISKDKKRKMIITASDVELSDVFEKFIELLLKNDRVDSLQNIMLAYQEQYRKSKNIFHGKLITAVEIDETTTQALISSIQHKIKGTLDLAKIVNPEILGGFILEVDFVRWDASLSGQLNSIKKQYIDRNRRII